MISVRIITALTTLAFLQGCGPTQNASNETPEVPQKASLRGAASRKAPMQNTDKAVQNTDNAQVSKLIDTLVAHSKRIHEGLELSTQMDVIMESDVMSEKFEAFTQSEKNIAFWRDIFGEEIPKNVQHVETKIAQLVEEEGRAYEVLAQEAQKFHAEKRTRISKAEKLAEAMKLVAVINQNTTCEQFEEFKKDPEMIKFWQDLFGEDLVNVTMTVGEMQTMVADFITKEQKVHDDLQNALHLEL